MDVLPGQLMFGAVAQIAEEAADAQYIDFVDKFKRKKTTDDCYTPEPVMRAVNEYVQNHYKIAPERFVRPFYPGGDYRAFSYAPEAVVVDNPPFSILAEILDFYLEKGISFFLFANALTVMNLLLCRMGRFCVVCAGVHITYENGARVNTSFITNLESAVARSAPALHEAVKAANAINLAAMTKQLPQYKYPDHVLTAAALNYMSCHGVGYTVEHGRAVFVRELDAQKFYKKQIYGGGLLLSDDAAAVRAEAEQQAKRNAVDERNRQETEDAIEWELSERERARARAMNREE